ncbi:hypothetical protein Droror1_Dr00023000 [Drosera rotundifolia]
MRTASEAETEGRGGAGEEEVEEEEGEGEEREKRKCAGRIALAEALRTLMGFFAPGDVDRSSRVRFVLRFVHPVVVIRVVRGTESDRTYSQEVVSEENRGTGGAGLRGLIDLNSFATEDDVPPVRTNMKRGNSMMIFVSYSNRR